jgi:beta-glucosidase-like glycosyl hydrolase
VLSRRAFCRQASSLAALPSSARAAVPAVSALSLEAKVGQLFLVAFEGTGEGAAAKVPELLLGQYLVGSVYLGPDNLTSVAETVALFRKLQSIGAATPQRLPIFASCDQEGAWCVLDRELTRGPGNFALGASSPQQVEAMYRVFGVELRALGIAADLAPMSDVIHRYALFWGGSAPCGG